MIKPYEAVGHLHLLWHFCLKFAERTGDLSRYNPRVICEAVGWDKDIDTFVNALRETGWIEKSGFKIHDWDDYTLHYHLSLQKREVQRDQVRERVRSWRDRRSNASVTLGNADVTQCNAPTLPDHTNKKNVSSPIGDLFESFWKTYPRKTAKSQALKSWKKSSGIEASFEKIMAALESQKSSRQWQQGIIPHAATWINQRRWEDELGLPENSAPKEVVI